MEPARLMLAAALIVLLGPALAMPNQAQAPPDLVRKSLSAERSVSYRGIKYADIWLGGRIIRAHFKILHQKPNRTRTEYFAPPELSGIVTIERGSESWHFLPSQQKWQHYKWELAPERIDLALENHRAIVSGQGTVAGRTAYAVLLLPKKRGNPSVKIWIDAHYYVVLKSELRNSAGAPISISAFRQIAFEPKDISDSAFDVRLDIRPPDNPVRKLGFEVVKPKYLPKGYSFVRMSTLEFDGKNAAHLMYTNGINTISIFERKRGGRDFGPWKAGIANVLRFDRGNITFTIISDIDKREMRKIADSLR